MTVARSAVVRTHHLLYTDGRKYTPVLSLKDTMSWREPCARNGEMISELHSQSY